MALKIIVVDDEPQALKLIKALVEPMGFEVLLIGDSREAAQRLENQKFHAIFVDARMPHLDGFELVRRVRASPSNGKVPIVMITGADDIATMQKSFKAGVTFFLGKPFNPDRLRGLFFALRGAMLREKRRYARLPLRTVVDCSLGQKRFKSGSLNISEGGMLLEPSGGAVLGQELDLRFLLPEGRAALNARAQAVRQETPDRIGVKFTGLSPEDREALRRYIAGNVKE